MAINGEIRQLYANREKTKLIYPRVSSNAVFLGNGNSLDEQEAALEDVPMLWREKVKQLLEQEG